MLAATTSSPTRLVPSEASSPTVMWTPLPQALSKATAPPAAPSSSPCVLPTASTSKTPASTYARPSSPSVSKNDNYALSSSPTSTSPVAYGLRPSKRARLADSPVTPAPVPIQLQNNPGTPLDEGTAAKAGGRGRSSAMAKRMSDAGCKMGSFKVQVAPAGRAKRAPTKAAPLPSSTAGPTVTMARTETPSGAIKGFRHMPEATPIASRTVARQPKLQEVKYDHGLAAEARSPASVGLSRVPSVLLPVPSESPVPERELSPVPCSRVPWSLEDDTAIMRLNRVMQGDFVWIARALRPVRSPNEVAQRHRQLTHASMTRSLSYSGSSRAPPPIQSNPMSKSASHAPSLFTRRDSLGSTPVRASLPTYKPTTFVIPNPKQPSPVTPAPSTSQALSSASLSRSYSCSSLPPRQLQQRQLSASTPASGPMRPMMPVRSGSVGGAGMVRLPSLREMMNEPWAGWNGADSSASRGAQVAAGRTEGA